MLGLTSCIGSGVYEFGAGKDSFILSISPQVVALTAGQTQQFTITGGSPPYTMSATLGSIASTGLFSSGWQTGSSIVTVSDTAGNSVAAAITIGSGGIQLGGGALSSTLPVSLQVDSAGSLYSYGNTTGTLGGTQLGSHGAQDVFLAKLDHNGSSVWTLQLGGGGASNTSGVGFFQNSSNLYIYGNTTGSLGGTEIGTAGSQDMFLAKITSAGALVWLVQIGGGSGNASSITTAFADLTGNVVLGGSTTGVISGGNLLGTHGNQDAVAAKITSLGALSWLNQRGGGATTLTSCTTMIQTVSGSVVISGITTGAWAGIPGGPGFSGSVNAYYDTFAATGGEVWGGLLGGQPTSITVPAAIINDSFGNFSAVGLSTGVTNGGVTNGGSQNLWIERLNPDGSVPNLTEWGGGGGTGTTPLSFVQDPGANFYVLGYTSGTLNGFTQVGVHGNQDAFLFKFNTVLNNVWSTQIGGGAATATTPTSFIRDVSGNFVLFGTTDGTIGGTQAGTHGAQDVFLSELNPAGASVWNLQLGAGAGTNTYATSFASDGAGNFYLVGSTRGSLPGTQIGNHGIQDAFLAKVTASGAIAWLVQMGGGSATSTLTNSVVQDSFGFSYLYGQTNGLVGNALIGNPGASSTTTFLGKFDENGNLQ